VFRYYMYGLDIESELEIPELRQSDFEQSDVQIHFAAVPETLSNATNAAPWLQVSGEECLMSVKDVGRFLIKNGREIVIDRRIDRKRSRGLGVPSSDIRLYLLGSAFGALIHQRNQLPFHVSAVDSGSGVWAFTGPSGAGKSTTAGWFNRHYGWPIISDDVSVVRPSDDQPLLYPGPRKLKLWSDAIDYLECGDANLKRDLSNTDKFQLYLNEKELIQAAPLQALIMLERCEPGEKPSLRRLTGLEAFRVCRLSIYRPIFEQYLRKRSEFVADIVNLTQSIQIYRFRRPWSLEAIPEHFAELSEQLGQQPLSKAG